jgi:histidinol dehydrogenase
VTQHLLNKTKNDNPCNKQYVESIEIDTFAKQVIDNKTKEGITCSKQYVESTENETNNDMAVTQYNPEKLFEKMENNFVQALEKVCKQQADMFASKMEVMENFYRKFCERHQL